MRSSLRLRAREWSSSRVDRARRGREALSLGYLGNVVDLCPVGALTSIDFRFRARVWEVSQTPSISVANAKGSNCFYWVRDNLVLNVSARTNPEVNEYWLADEDRLGYKTFNENRPEGPTVGGQLTDWTMAQRRAAEILGIDKATLYRKRKRFEIE